jgi:hypothetical protein
MSKVTIKYAINSLNPELPFTDGTDWTGNDAIVFSNFRKEVLQPLSSMYYGQSVYANTTYRSITFSFANTAIAMEYYNKRNQANGAASIAVQNLRKQKVDQGLAAPFELVAILTDENNNETILTPS